MSVILVLVEQERKKLYNEEREYEPDCHVLCPNSGSSIWFPNFVFKKREIEILYKYGQHTGKPFSKLPERRTIVVVVLTLTKRI